MPWPTQPSDEEAAPHPHPSEQQSIEHRLEAEPGDHRLQTEVQREANDPNRRQLRRDQKH